MGLFSSKRQQQEAAARFTAAAGREAAEARKLKKQAEKVREQNRNAVYPDNAATRAIARDLEANRRVREANAKDLRDMAAASKRAARRWF
jgi:hypothetical protein